MTWLASFLCAMGWHQWEMIAIKLLLNSNIHEQKCFRAGYERKRVISIP